MARGWRGSGGFSLIWSASSAFYFYPA